MVRKELNGGRIVERVGERLVDRGPHGLVEEHLFVERLSRDGRHLVRVDRSPPGGGLDGPRTQARAQPFGLCKLDERVAVDARGPRGEQLVEVGNATPEAIAKPDEPKDLAPRGNDGFCAGDEPINEEIGKLSAVGVLHRCDGR